MSYGEIKAIYDSPKARDNGCSCSETSKSIIHRYEGRSTTISLWESRAQASSKNLAPILYN